MDHWMKGRKGVTKGKSTCYLLCLSRHRCTSGASFSLQVVEMEGHSYGVFLSFSRWEKHADFIHHLYTRLIKAGVHTFRDEEDLPIGEEIGPSLPRVIEQSKISIPVFSKSYASSRWRLNELAQMVECWKRKGQVIMPIFYHVEPSEVQHQTGDYGEALLGHKNEKRLDNETIRKWRAALNEVGGLNGWIIDDMTNRHEQQQVEHVVTTVLHELKDAYLAVSDFLVGVEKSVEEVLGMIGTDTNDVKIIGIHGMGGIGKTTLAKVVYNKLSLDFYSRCFLADVRETSHSKGIVWLQNQLISYFVKQAHSNIIHCIDDGIRMIEDRFSREKVLILLDDVDKKNQLIALLGRLSCFGPGSRILITTRNANVLREFGVKLTYLVDGLDPDISLQLFSKHVFKRDYPPTEKMEKSREFVNIAKGLPLILEFMGSILSTCGQKEEIWDDYLVKWKKDGIKEIRSTLMISYDALNSSQRQIFLDIACYFAGYDNSMAMYMWKDSGLFPEVELEVLQSMSLIKIGEDNKLWMHDLLKDLGKEIVSQESGGKLGKRSRLWNYKDVLKTLLRNKGTESVEAVVPKFESYSQCSSTPEQFATTSNIRFLRLDRANEGNFKSLLPRLRWLHWSSWRGIPGAENLNLEKLVVLDLSGSKITEKWIGWREIEKAENLKVLDLNGCVNLIRTPDFTHFKHLERLILESCIRLVEIGSSVGSLQRLVLLNLKFCPALTKLPEELGSLASSPEILTEGTPVQVEFSRPANTEHSSFKGVEVKYEGNEGGIDNIWTIDDQLKELNSLPDSDIKWSKIGTKILVSDKEIGKGSNGTTVYEGIYEGRDAAVKSLVRGHHDVAMVEIQNLILSDGHENIVRYYGMGEEQKFVYLALEHCICSLDDLIQAHSDSSNNSRFPDDPASTNAYKIPDDPASTNAYKIKLGSVRDKMQDVNLWSADGYPSSQLLKLMSDMVSGLSHLHNLGMIHRDIKPQNILITKNPSFGAKLSDMGISKCLPKDRSSLGYHATGCGTTGWRAPEQLSHGGRQTQKMDMFSLGCVLFFCVTHGKHPFGDTIRRDSNIAENKKDLTLVKIPEARDLISRLLNPNLDLRPTALEVLQHPFFWSSRMRLTFLQVVSNVVEPGAGKGDSDLLKELENIAQLVFDGNWIKEIDADVMDDLRLHRRKPYDGSSLGDLLRVVRNKFSHLKDAPRKVQAILGSDHNGLDAYFTKRFPRLLIESYKVVSQSCEKEKLLDEVLSK